MRIMLHLHKSAVRRNVNIIVSEAKRHSCLNEHIPENKNVNVVIPRYSHDFSRQKRWGKTVTSQCSPIQRGLPPPSILRWQIDRELLVTQTRDFPIEIPSLQRRKKLPPTQSDVQL